MKIYLKKDGEESGPYTREQIYKLLKEGGATNDDSARLENSQEWAPLGKVLAAGAGLFSVAKIQEVAQQLPEVELFVPDLSPTPPRPTVDEPKKSLSWQPLVFLALFLLLGMGYGIYYAVSSQPVPVVIQLPLKSTLAVLPPATQKAIVENTPAPSPTLTPTLAEITPSPVPAAVIAQVEPKPDISPELPSDLQSAAPPMPTAPPAATPEPAISTAIVVHQIQFPRLKNIEKVEMWQADTDPNPQGIFLLYLNGPWRSPAETCREPIWQAFARAHHYTLISFSFSAKKGVPVDYGKVGTDLLERGLAINNTPSLPVVIYASGSTNRLLATSYLAAHPNLIKAWAIFSDDLDPKFEVKSDAPGLIACNYEQSVINRAFRSLFNAGRSQNKRWTWLPLSGSPDTRFQKFEAFLLRYLDETILATGDPQWAGITTRQKVSILDQIAAPQDASWLPADSLLPAWTELLPPAEHLIPPSMVNLEIKTRCPDQPTISFFLRIPSNCDKNHPVKGTLAFCTWIEDAKIIAQQMAYRPGQVLVDQQNALVGSLISFADEHHLALVTWTTANVWNNDASTGELNQKDRLRYDRNFDLVANAWEKGMETFHRQNGVPDNDLLLYGISRGAQWAHRLALRKPTHFLAVHFHVASTFDTPTPEAKRVMWLVTTGELEYGYEKSKQFYAQCNALGYPIIFKAIMGLGHADSSIADNLGFRFFDYALRFKEARENAEKGPSASMLALKGQDKDPWMAPFRHPEFIGDLLNQEVYPLKQADMVPVALQVPLPTEELAKAWNQ